MHTAGLTDNVDGKKKDFKKATNMECSTLSETGMCCLSDGGANDVI